MFAAVFVDHWVVVVVLANSAMFIVMLLDYIMVLAQNRARVIIMDADAARADFNTLGKRSRGRQQKCGGNRGEFQNSMFHVSAP